MKVRLGYVAMALRLPDCSPSKTITVKNINKIASHTDQLNRLTRITRENLSNTLRILKANFFDRIQVYRFTSKLVPLCTHPQFTDWDYVSDSEDLFQEIGALIRENKMRVSLHPDHFTLLNSPSPEVLEASLRDLDYHVKILEAMRLNGNEAKLVIHVGGKYNDRIEALNRFKNTYLTLPRRISERLILENDDRCFTAQEVLCLAQEIAAPMVLDVHHHQLLNQGESLESLLPDIFATWGGNRPKVHLSSPRDQKNPRNHADYIDPESATGFLNLARKFGRDFDLMLEAKQKDLALFKLAEDLRGKGFTMPNDGEIVWD